MIIDLLSIFSVECPEDSFYHFASITLATWSFATMKTLFSYFRFAVLSTLLIIFAGCASGPKAGDPAKNLNANMKAMGARFKKLNEQIDKPALNVESAKLASELGALAVNGKQFSPKILSSMNDADQKKAKADFDDGMNIITKLSGELATALTANDNVKAKDLLKQMNDTRKYGHDTYKK
jgi:hypothetical protein